MEVLYLRVNGSGEATRFREVIPRVSLESANLPQLLSCLVANRSGAGVQWLPPDMLKRLVTAQLPPGHPEEMVIRFPPAADAEVFADHVRLRLAAAKAYEP